MVIAEKGVRVGGYLIDFIPAVLMGLFGLIPLFGIIIAGLLLVPYWLLRDITGASLGKLLLGTRVMGKDGQEASVGARILRNLPLAVGPAFFIIPVLGYLIGPPIALLAILIEAILVVTQGERLGDRLAGTVVVKKADKPASLSAAA